MAEYEQQTLWEMCKAQADRIKKLEKALANETERCAKIAEGFPKNREWVPGSLYDTLRKEVAADIRRLANSPDRP